MIKNMSKYVQNARLRLNLAINRVKNTVSDLFTDLFLGDLDQDLVVQKVLSDLGLPHEAIKPVKTAGPEPICDPETAEYDPSADLQRFLAREFDYNGDDCPVGDYIWPYNGQSGLKMPLSTVKKL